MALPPGRVAGYAWPRFGAWRSLVARLFWVQEVVGSSPAAPTSDAAVTG